MTVLNSIQSSNRRFVSVSEVMSAPVRITVTKLELEQFPDGDLVRRTIRGDRPAFDELIQRYQRQAVSVSYRLLGNVQDSLEVTQDAFLKAYKNLSTLQKPAAFGGWLMRIVANLSLNYRRGRRVRAQLPLDELMNGPETTPFERSIRGETRAAGGDPAHLTASAEMGRQLATALKCLPERQRVALTLFTIEGLSQKQIAETLACSVEAVKWHVFQARKALKVALKEYL
jgi:RNA polymerase sigma-70 factor, ECF subfamily